MAVTEGPHGVLISRVHSRIGLLGNPSDGFEGACLSLSLANFYAEVTLTPSPTLRFLPNPECDGLEFESPQGLVRHVRGCGYHGGIRLLQAMCTRFFEHCQERGIALPPSTGNFALAYTTTIPRQRGLSGSSAIACAALNCLLRHAGAEAAIPPADRPHLVLSAEQDLGIAAGLQDRVVQVYGGLVFMDFSQPGMRERGHGCYEPLDPALLPPLLLMYDGAAAPGKDSGGVHSDVKQQWLAGDDAVRHDMQELAGLARQGVQALRAGDLQLLAELMTRNLQLRRQVYGDAAVGAANIAMVQTAAAAGAAAKLTGSGGAVVALCPGGEQQAQQLRRLCKRQGLACEEVVVGPALHSAPQA